MTTPAVPALPITVAPGLDYHGHATLCVASPHLWIDVLAQAGPRIVRLGLTGSGDNLLAETPDIGWQTPHGRYELFGGHRLWFAPEDPDRVAVPDLDGLLVEPLADGIRLIGRVESPTGLVRVIAMRLDPATASFEVRQELHHRGEGPLELAPWSITQLPLGGRVVLPQPPPADGHGVRPNRNLVLWPYTSWTDARLALADGAIMVHAVAGADLKVGYLSDAGWVAYVRGGTALVQRFEPALGLRHPDLECNVETYCGSRYLELEVLGPLRVLAPGESSVLVERWEVRSDVAGLADPAALCEVLEQPM